MDDFSYEDLVVSHADNYTRVFVPEEKMKRINALVDLIVERKQKEKIHQIDNNKERKRFFYCSFTQ